MATIFVFMISFQKRLLKFGSKGEKTGWTYIDIDIDLASQLNPNTKKSFRVKGKLDQYIYKGIALIPMGDGAFIFAVNSDMRKQIKKEEGAMVKVEMEVDLDPLMIDQELLDCLTEDPMAQEYFESLAKSHQMYFSKWINSAKTLETRTKRMVKVMRALSRHMDYAQMIREKSELF